MLARALSPLVEPAYTLLRFLSGFLFATHGMQKLFGWFGREGAAPELGTQVWFGAIIELVCGLAIAFGFLTSWAAFLASGTMAVAYFQFHWKLGDAPFLPLQNGGTPAVLYCLIFFYVACRGAGRWGFDRVRPEAR